MRKTASIFAVLSLFLLFMAGGEVQAFDYYDTDTKVTVDQDIAGNEVPVITVQTENQEVATFIEAFSGFNKDFADRKSFLRQNNTFYYLYSYTISDILIDSPSESYVTGVLKTHKNLIRFKMSYLE